MSKKTIVFKMPATGPRPRDDEPRDAAFSSDDFSPAASARRLEAAQTPSRVKPDQWVRRRDLNGAPGAVAPLSPGSSGKNRFAIDLAAERDLSEVVALSLIVPPMLSWFWFANAVDRYRRIFAT